VVFCADQRLRRTHALGHVHHIEAVSVDHVVEVATALFLDTVDTVNWITSEGL
jgi:hypothetical protein